MVIYLNVRTFVSFSGDSVRVFLLSCLESGEVASSEAFRFVPDDRYFLFDKPSMMTFTYGEYYLH